VSSTHMKSRTSVRWRAQEVDSSVAFNVHGTGRTTDIGNNKVKQESGHKNLRPASIICRCFQLTYPLSGGNVFPTPPSPTRHNDADFGTMKDTEISP